MASTCFTLLWAVHRLGGEVTVISPNGSSSPLGGRARSGIFAWTNLKVMFPFRLTGRDVASHGEADIWLDVQVSMA